ncbi:MAG: hypothetical protein GX168_09150 [Bacteroidales bacterium]|nr:hypothetical protein [Bacteroidales bacterium]
MKKILFIILPVLLMLACNRLAEKPSEEASPVSAQTISTLTDALIETHGEASSFRIERGISQAASLWRSSDGSVEDFEAFVLENFIADPAELDLVFDRMATYLENIYGYNNRMTIELNRIIHEDRGPIHKLDQVFGAYSPTAHLQEDLYNNKVAFIVALNFPYYSLEEKNELGGEWDARQWGFARLGEMFTARVPPRLLQEMNEIYSAGRLYISEYNIFAGQLLNEAGEKRFPEDMKLLAHWNIRDEIKSNYALEDGLEKQEMLYNVMLHIIRQDIPKQVINNPAYQWNPFTNELFRDGQAVECEPEDLERYEHLLANFQALRNVDPYYPNLDTYIKRRFDADMEIPLEEVEALFREYAASPLLREVGQIISRRLGRPLRPFDLWYDGFTSRSSIPEDDLTHITQQRYPTPKDFDNDLPRILREAGFQNQTAEFIASKVDVDPARGSGHAWGASMRDMPSHLRTRIGPNGMDYKGYNIAVHEFGHNVEQTISLQMVDNYMINGVPNTAFTEALAFMLQSRDLQFLGMQQDNPMKETLDVLDIFWDNYEMMGVSLVDMTVWKWLYDHPEATSAELKEAVIRIATDIWNEYYADVFGESDIPLLAIYSHMIQSPLYLMNYPYGRLIMFQLEDYYRGKDFAAETQRIFSLGRLTPRHWMERAVGQQISNQPIFQAVEKAVGVIKEQS